jgi:nucleoside-diphosphate-sugar epimerase
MAEKLAWEMVGKQDRWDLVCINPGLVLGPSLTGASDSGSLFLLDEVLGGKFFYGVPNLSFTTVDVREVAAAHIAASRLPSASGRYILAAKQMSSFLELADLVRPFHDNPGRLPRWQLPEWLVRLIGPLFGLSKRFIDNHLGIRFSVDNQRSITELGISYRPLRETMKDHYLSWKGQESCP